MIEVPKRKSLIHEAAEVIRRSLQRGEWSNGLPPERLLSDQLHVSRPTLRLALKVLQREGLVELAGSPRQWTPVQNSLPRRQSSDLVQFLSCDRFDSLTRHVLLHLLHLRRELQDANMRLEVLTDVRLKRARPERLLEQIVSRSNAACWILSHSTPAVQRWFARRQLRVIVKGTCFDETQFPSIDTDHRALAYHAAGMLLRLGHRRIALLRPNHQGAGEVMRERGFLEAFDPTHSDATPIILRHDGSETKISSVIRAAMRSKNRPTAILASECAHALNALNLFLTSGVHVPQQVSIISCDDELFMRHVKPTIARYSVDSDAYAKRFSRMVVKLATTGVLTNRPARVIPPFVSGESVAAPPPV